MPGEGNQSTTIVRRSTVLQQAQEARLATSPSNFRRAWRRFRANKLAVLALIIVGLLALLAIGAPLISQYISHVSPTKQRLINQFAPISREHWLGTDELGRDVLTRIAYGGRVSLAVGFAAALATAVIGTLTGAAAAYYGGWVDAVIMRFVDVMLSIPTLFVLILMSSLITLTPVSMPIVIAAFAWYSLARLIRAQILSIKKQEYVEAARVLGATDRQILFRHIIPNVTYLIIYSVTGAIPGFILSEAALSYLGLGIQPPTPSWGNMLTNATQYLYESKGLLFYPGICIWLTVLAMTVVGNALRDALDTRLSE